MIASGRRFGFIFPVAAAPSWALDGKVIDRMEKVRDEQYQAPPEQH